MFRCFWKRTILGSLLVGILSSQYVRHGHAAQQADETAVTADEKSQPALKVKITDVEASLDARNQPTYTLSLIIAVNVENTSDQAITIAREQFQLLLNDAPVEIGSVASHPSFSRATLEPGKSAEGWIGFGSIVYDGTEPSMVLRWQPPAADANVDAAISKRADINLNEELRRQSDYKLSRLGPEDCLLQIATNRNLDVLAIWPVAELLRNAAKENVSRILFSSATEKRLVIHEEFNLWLSAMIDTGVVSNDPNLRFGQRLTPPFPKQEIKFQQFLLGGITEAGNRQYGLYRRPISVLETAEAAIAQALTPVYRHLATEIAVADLQNSNPGVRRAAMAGAVDRLTPEQAEIIIDEALRGSPELQLEMAGYLNLIPGAKSVETLRILSDSADPKVSVVALRSLISSLDPAAESAMTELWRASHGKPEKQNQILSAIIQLNSERWTSLVAGYVADRFQEAAASGSSTVASIEASTPVAEVDEYDPPDSVSGGNQMVGNQTSLMGSALAFLRAQGHAGTLEVLRQHLLKIGDAGLQDIALASLVEARDPADDAMLRECLDLRIRSNTISDSIRTAIVELPSSQWTEILLQDLKTDKALPNPPLAAQAMLRCASAGQLDHVIDSFDTLSTPAKQQTLRHLAMLDHPRWKPLAKNLIDAPLQHVTNLNQTDRAMFRSIVAETIQLLAIDASEESITMLTERLTKAVAEIGNAEEIPIENRMFAHSLIEKVSMFAHPECRRCLNRVARCDNQDLRDKAVRQIQDAMRRSPAIQMLAMRLNNLPNPPNQTRRLDDNEETVEFYAECIELDPYLTEMYVRRASVLMHLGRFEETMADLKIASRLSPENMDVESMIALCRIRLGETEAGLKYAEELVVTAPRDLSSLYNGACSYSRALENSKVTDEQKKKYGDRAIELIRQTIATEFEDFEHLQTDEDLVSLHAHPEWQAVVDETKKMHDELMKRPPE